MRLVEEKDGKRRRAKYPRRRSDHPVFRRRRRLALLVLTLLLATPVLSAVGAHRVLSSDPPEGGAAAPPPERAGAPSAQPEEAPRKEPAAQEVQAAEEEDAKNKEEKEEPPPPPAPPAPSDPTMYLTVPKLGVYGHMVRNDESQYSLDLGAIHLPRTGFPWQPGSNTYIACHRLGWPGTESYNQCLNLPLMQVGDEIVLEDADGRAYEYRVSESFEVDPYDTWVLKPVPGRDVVSLQTCIEALGDHWTMGPNWFARYVVRADRVG